MADVLMPQLGETVVEGTITRWFVGVGEAVVIDQPLYEVSTEKVDSEVPSPVGGVLVEIVAGEGAVVPVGAVLCRIDSAGSGVASTGTAPSAATPGVEEGDALGSADVIGTDDADGVEAVAPGQSVVAPVGASERRGEGLLLSPVVRGLLSEHGVDPSRVTGTGVGGRITRADVEQFLRENPGRAEPFDGIRRATARHMVGSKATSPHVLTAMEVDYTAVDMLRSAEKEAWRVAEGASLTYLPFIVSALCDALAEFPRLNASVGDDELIVHGTVNLAVAVDLDFEGLVAPVVRGVEDRSIQEVARAIVDVATRARSRSLSTDDLSGGTFTVTNPGQYGTLFQFPIINQPQVAILSTDGIVRRPAVVADADGNESIEARSLGVLALAWDHRAFDGAYAAAFLRSMKRTLEDADWATRWEAGRATDGEG
ncbi:MAG: dihydrolipoyllysine-residue acetyltransferase component of pyruvate dehydrogenase complex [Acidimicrobiales bacterium]|jgi:2-oxoglutarate dehydrogenase E2 component (dihydrolipoamide succinyltransferase)|nr:MAG: dihydrolipoyllysine-residue acetyltransferase component of pyruvate dehydrogenase complex [Acidimicrobiales bacterium]